MDQQPHGTSNGSGALAPTPPPPREIRVVQDTIDILDTARFEHLQRVCAILSASTLIPDSLRFETRKINNENVEVELTERQVTANVFMVVETAVRWGLSPSQVLGGSSIVHGKLCFEGKIIHAAIKSKLGIDLRYEFTNEGRGDALKVTVSGVLPAETNTRTITGSVKQWHKGPKSPWSNPLDWERQLRYRGAREWCRAHSPGVLLGAYGDDEFEDLRSDRHSFREPARPAIAPPAFQRDTERIAGPEIIAPPKPSTPTPPAFTRSNAQDAEDIPAEHKPSDEKPSAPSGSDLKSAVGEARGQRAPVPPTPPPSRQSGGTKRGGEQFNLASYMRQLEHDITCCECMDEVIKVWDAHMAFVNADPSKLPPEAVKEALGFYNGAIEIFES